MALKVLAGPHGHDDGVVRIGGGGQSFDPTRDIGTVCQQALRHTPESGVYARRMCRQLGME